jgi:hypothetical protein
MDTKDWAHREIVRRLRLMTPAQRLLIAFDRIEMGRDIQRLAMERSALARADGSHD